MTHPRLVAASPPLDRSPQFGRSLEQWIASQAPQLDDLADGFDLDGWAADSPFIRRVAYVLDVLAGVPAITRADAARWMAEGADCELLQRATLLHDRERGPAEALVAPTLANGLLDIEDLGPKAGKVIVPGAAARLVTDDPLAAWSGPLLDVLLGDPLLDVGSRWFDRGLLAVPVLLFQVIVTDERPVRLRPLARGLRDEIAAATPVDERPPTVAELSDRVAAVVALLSDFSVIDWQPTASALGSATRTPLGRLAVALVNVYASARR